MKYLAGLATFLALMPAVTIVGAFPPPPPPPPSGDVNPFLGKALFANKAYAQKLETTIKTFTKQKDLLNAARTRTVQKIPSFVWVANVAGVSVFYYLHNAHQAI